MTPINIFLDGVLDQKIFLLSLGTRISMLQIMNMFKR